MTIRIPDFNANGYNNGESPIPSTDANDTNNALLLRFKHFDDDTEHSATTSWNYVTSFNITGVSGGVLVGIALRCQMKGAAGTTKVNIKISGATIVTKYIATKDVGDARIYLGHVEAGTDDNTIAPVISTVEQECMFTTSTDYQTMAVNGFFPMLLPDATTTISIGLKNDTGGCNIDSIDLDLIYAEAASDES